MNFSIHEVSVYNHLNVTGFDTSLSGRSFLQSVTYCPLFLYFSLMRLMVSDIKIFVSSDGGLTLICSGASACTSGASTDGLG